MKKGSCLECELFMNAPTATDSFFSQTIGFVLENLNILKYFACNEIDTRTKNSCITVPYRKKYNMESNELADTDFAIIFCIVHLMLGSTNVDKCVKRSKQVSKPL